MSALKHIFVAGLFVSVSSQALGNADASECLGASPDTAAQVCKRWARWSGESIGHMLQIGARLERKHHYTAALSVYHEGLLKHPGNHRLERAQFFASSDLEETRNSASANSRGRASPSSTGRAQLESIKCKRLTGDIAIASCRNAIALVPSDLSLHQKLARTLAQLGQSPESSSQHGRPQIGETSPSPPEQTPSTDSPRVSYPTRRETTSARVVPSNRDQAELPAAPADATATGSRLVGQVTLLHELHQRRLISDAELVARKQDLLSQAFGHGISTPEPASHSPPTTPLPSLELGRYHALVIGNNRYTELPSLKTGVADADAVSRVLRDSYGFKVTTLVDAKRYDIIKELARLRAELTERDNVMIYYAGHGHLDEATERGYWLPVDAEESNPANWISTTDVTDTLKGMHALHALVVSDSCYSGSLNRALSPQATSAVHRHAVLERLAVKRSRTVMTSGGLEPVLDSGGGNHSTFAGAFLTALRENDGVIEAARLFEELRAKVVLEADQTPEYASIRKAGHEGGDFIFVRRR